MGTVSDFIFLGSKITVDGDCKHEIKRCFLLGRKAVTNLDYVLKSRDITLSTKIHIVKAMVFPVVIYRCDAGKVNRLSQGRIDAFKLCCQRRLLRVSYSKEIKSVNPKGNHIWIFIGKTDPKAEGAILWPPNAKGWLTRIDPDAGNDWKQAEKGTTEDKMVGWHHQFSRHEFEQISGSSEGQGSLACCNP